MENNNPPSEQQINDQFNQQFNRPGFQVPIPNSTASLVLGIISIALCWCYGLPALICGIIALVLANKGNALYNENPGQYTIGSYSNLKAGRVCGIIGICLSVLAFLYFIIIIAFYGAMLSSMPWQGFR